MRMYKEQYYLTIICGGLPLIVAIIVGTPVPDWYDKLINFCLYGWITGIILIQLYKSFK